MKTSALLLLAFCITFVSCKKEAQPIAQQPQSSQTNYDTVVAWTFGGGVNLKYYSVTLSLHDTVTNAVVWAAPTYYDSIPAGCYDYDHRDTVYIKTPGIKTTGRYKYRMLVMMGYNPSSYPLQGCGGSYSIPISMWSTFNTPPCTTIGLHRIITNMSWGYCLVDQ